MNKIDANARSISELLSAKKYSIDYYQREYKWGKEQIIELMEDLEAKFLQDYDEEHEYDEVQRYKHYFMGPVIISNHDTHKFIIDGQQRLTSLTLLLIFLNNLQKHFIDDDQQVNLHALIFSTHFGKKSFNIDVPEREPCLQALFAEKLFETDGESEAVQTMVARYQDINDNFSISLRNGALIHFIYWLINNVDLIEITTYSDDEAYTIFETMNDRGLRLTPTDMLKGYLLANISPDERAKTNDLWKDRLLELSELGKDEDSNFFKAWLRAKYAESIREHKKGASNRDFDIIGTNYHKWIHDQSKHIGLIKSADFSDFVMNRFKRFSGYYMQMQQASKHLIPGMEYIFYNAHNNFTLQYPLMLAPLKAEDDQDTIHRKIRLVSGYLDIFIARRAVNFRTLDYSSIVYTMFNLMKEIRELDLHTLAETLKSKVASMDESFDGMSRFSLNLWSKRYIQHILARITRHIEEQSGMDSRFETYVSREIKQPYEIEHIWANKYGRHKDEFATEEEFIEYRNRIGNLILLPRDINRSIGDMAYESKLNVYRRQNLLAGSLEKQRYQNNPSLLTYIRESGLPIRSHETFKKADLDERQKLYQLICEEIWSPARFDKELRG